MSDPTWSTRTLPAADEAIIYVQAAGTAGAPAAADELAFVSDFSIEIKGDRSKKGPWLNLNKKKSRVNGVEVTGSCTIDWSKAADATRAMLVNAALNGTRVKITAEIYASGDKFVSDQAAIDATVALSASDGTTGEFSFDIDLPTYTAATA